MADEQSDNAGKKQSSPTIYLTNRVIIGAMITINIIILQSLIAIQKLDDYLHNAIIAISVALPLLVSTFILHDFPLLTKEENKEDSQERKFKVPSYIERIIRIFVTTSGTIATLIGVGNIIYHIAQDAGEVFVGFSIILYLSISFYAFFFVSSTEEQK